MYTYNMCTWMYVYLHVVFLSIKGSRDAMFWSTQCVQKTRLDRAAHTKIHTCTRNKYMYICVYVCTCTAHEQVILFPEQHVCPTTMSVLQACLSYKHVCPTSMSVLQACLSYKHVCPTSMSVPHMSVPQDVKRHHHQRSNICMPHKCMVIRGSYARVA